MITVDEARERMLTRVIRLGSESVALEHLDGRTLAASVHAARDQPPFNASVMDGYAFRAADSPGALTIVGEAAAGRAFSRSLGANQAVRISTGAPMPAGANAVLPQEDAVIDQDLLRASATSQGSFVRARAGDFAAGATLLEDGFVVGPGGVMAIAGAGHARIEVTRKPIIAILANGDELVAPGDTPRDDQIFEAASYAVASLVRAWGGRAHTMPILTDARDAMSGAIRTALATSDVLVVIGGASVGPHDHVRPTVRELGGEMLVEGVAVRPGKPTWFAGLPDGRSALGLPGNPASALVCARLFLAPLLETMLTGGQAQSRAYVRRTLSAPMPANGARESYVRAIATDLSVAPILNEDSSMIHVLARSNCLVRRPTNTPACPAQETVDCIAWRPTIQ